MGKVKKIAEITLELGPKLNGMRTANQIPSLIAIDIIKEERGIKNLTDLVVNDKQYEYRYSYKNNQSNWGEKNGVGYHSCNAIRNKEIKENVQTIDNKIKEVKSLKNKFKEIKNEAKASLEALKKDKKCIVQLQQNVKNLRQKVESKRGIFNKSIDEASNVFHVKPQALIKSFSEEYESFVGGIYPVRNKATTFEKSIERLSKLINEGEKIKKTCENSIKKLETTISTLKSMREKEISKIY